MKIGRTERNTNIYIGNNRLKQVTEFTYLGSNITTDGRSSIEIHNRCSKAYQALGQMTPIFRNKNVDLNTKITLFKTIIMPTLCYQCQTWTTTAQDKRKLVTAEMACLRRIIGISLRDRVRNEDIRQRTGTTPILEYIKRQQIKWFAHISRLPPDSIPQQAMLHRYSEGRPRGRPRKRWTTEIKEATNSTIYSAHTRAISKELFYP